jgi:hypothetical protein
MPNHSGQFPAPGGVPGASSDLEMMTRWERTKVSNLCGVDCVTCCVEVTCGPTGIGCLMPTELRPATTSALSARCDNGSSASQGNHTTRPRDWLGGQLFEIFEEFNY